MNAVIRVDSSIQIGSGHLMRCLALAERLRKEKLAEVHFISRDLPRNLYELVWQKEFQLHLLPRHATNPFLAGYAAWLMVPQEMDADETQEILLGMGRVDLLIVDNYSIDIAWESRMRPLVNKLFVIDDLANRKHDCDILLDQNFYLNKDSRYDGLVPSTCELRLGPQYALLREEFYEAKKHLRKRNGEIHRIFVFYGGSDSTNETMKALHALERLAFLDATVDVVVGGSNLHKGEIEDFCQKYEFLNFYCQVDNMAELMNKADLALGAGGTTIWERLYLELPSVVTAIAENQVKICEDCARIGYIDYIGIAEQVNDAYLRERVSDYLSHGIIAKKWNFNLDWCV